MRVKPEGVSLMMMMVVVVDEEKVRRCGFKERSRRIKMNSAVCVFLSEVPILPLLFFSFLFLFLFGE